MYISVHMNVCMYQLKEPQVLHTSVPVYEYACICMYIPIILADVCI